MSDPYGILGVRPDASDEEIGKAYKRLAKRYHPDLNPNDPAAAARMGQINQAYDEIKRLRQSGQRFDAAGAYSPYGHRAAAGADYGGEYVYRRPPSPFRVAVAAMLAVLLLRLFAVLLGGTAPAQRVRERYAPTSGEMPPYNYYMFTHLYP